MFLIIMVINLHVISRHKYNSFTGHSMRTRNKQRMISFVELYSLLDHKIVRNCKNKVSITSELEQLWKQDKMDVKY